MSLHLWPMQAGFGRRVPRKKTTPTAGGGLFTRAAGGLLD